MNRHFPTLAPNGVLQEDAVGEVQFQALAPPTLGGLKQLARRIIPRLLRKLAADSDFFDQSDWLRRLAQSQKTGSGLAITDPSQGLCVLAQGFAIHAGIAIDELDRDGLERLARYCARSPLALRRLTLADDGQILYRVKQAVPGAPGLLRLSLSQCLGRLAAS